MTPEEERVFVPGYFKECKTRPRGARPISIPQTTENESQLHMAAKTAIDTTLRHMVANGESLSIWYKDKDLTDRAFEIPLLTHVNHVRAEAPIRFGDKHYRADVLLSNKNEATGRDIPIAAIEVIHKNHLSLRKVADMKALGIPVISVMLSDVVTDNKGYPRKTEMTPEGVSAPGWAKRVLSATTLDHERGYRPTYLFIPPLFHLLYSQKLKARWDWFFVFPGDHDHQRMTRFVGLLKAERTNFIFSRFAISYEKRKRGAERKDLAGECEFLQEYRDSVLGANPNGFARIFIKPQEDKTGARDQLTADEFLFLALASRLGALEAPDCIQAIAPRGHAYSQHDRFWCDAATGDRFMPVILNIPMGSAGIHLEKDENSPQHRAMK